MTKNPNKPNSSLRSLTREAPTKPEDQHYYKKYLNEPIPLAILYCSLLENDLEEILLSKFHRKDAQTIDRLTKSTGPISTFHQKIELAYALGILNEDFRSACHTVRSIRNVFAHSRKLFEFEHHLITSELRKIKIFKNSTKNKDLEEMIKKGEHPKVVYITTCLYISTALAKRQTKALKARLQRTRRKFVVPEDDATK